MVAHRVFLNVIMVRLGMVSGAILGGLAGYVSRTITTPGETTVLTWPVVLGSILGFFLAWAVLTWLTHKHHQLVIFAGTLLMIAAIAGLALWQAVVFPSGLGPLR